MSGKLADLISTKKFSHKMKLSGFEEIPERVLPAGPVQSAQRPQALG